MNVPVFMHGNGKEESREFVLCLKTAEWRFCL